MCDKIYFCTFENKCPIGEGEDLYRCCNTCENPCDDACVLNRRECAGSIIFSADEFSALKSCHFPSAESVECGEAI